MTDARIHELNRVWRGYDKPTDVLSWPFSETLSRDEPFLGDVAISVETTARQARQREWRDGDEAALLLLHGILHLLGYEDATESGAAQMRDIEERILGKPLDELSQTN